MLPSQASLRARLARGGGLDRAATGMGPKRKGREAARAAQVPPEPPPARRAAGPGALLTEEEAVPRRVGLAAPLRAVPAHGTPQPVPGAHATRQADGDQGARAPAPARTQQRQQREHGVHRCRAPRGVVPGLGPAARRRPLSPGVGTPSSGLGSRSPPRCGWLWRLRSEKSERPANCQ